MGNAIYARLGAVLVRDGLDAQTHLITYLGQIDDLQGRKRRVATEFLGADVSLRRQQTSKIGSAV